MCLAALGRERLDQLQAWVLDEFGSLPAPSSLPSPTAPAAPAPGHGHSHGPSPAADEPLSPAASLPLSSAQLGSTLSVRPVREARSLRLMWAVSAHPNPNPSPNPDPDPDPNPDQESDASALVLCVHGIEGSRRV